MPDDLIVSGKALEAFPPFRLTAVASGGGLLMTFAIPDRFTALTKQTG